MPLILGANSVSGYTVKNSLRFNSGSSDYLSRTYGTPTNNLKYTKSFWIKRSGLTDIAKGFVWCSSTNTNTDYFYFNSSDYIVVGNSVTPATSAVFRDVSAWYHCVMVFDSANATASNRLILYVNNVQQTLDSTITQNSTGGNQSGVTYTIGNQGGVGRYLDAYMSEVYMIDGQALTPSSFGETDTLSGIWIPKAYTGTYGTNGFYLKFANSASLGTDSSGNGNNFTVNNLTSVDQSTDTPTNNFATLNALNNVGTGANPTYSEGNLKTISSADNYFGGSGNIGVTTGKWYLEVKLDAQSSSGQGVIGMSTNIFEEARQNRHMGQLTSNPSVGYYGSNGNKVVDGGTDSSYGNSYTAGDIIGIAIDLTNNYIYFSKNGTFQNSGVPTSGSSGTGGIALTSTTREWFLSLGDGGSTATATYLCNFGSPNYSANSYTDSAGYGNFSYQVPSGFYSLCTRNLSTQG